MKAVEVVVMVVFIISGNSEGHSSCCNGGIYNIRGNSEGHSSCCSFKEYHVLKY